MATMTTLRAADGGKTLNTFYKSCVCGYWLEVE
jgi:hypothetical protein